MKETKQSEEQTGGKPLKAPGKLSKPVKKDIFEKKYVKYIENPTDNSFFTGAFELQGNVYIQRKDLKKDDIKNLKRLLKVIKTNRKGAVKFVPLAIAAVFVGAVVIFFSIFANPLLERAMEQGLEAVFEAKSDVYHFRLSLIRFRIAISGITVANRDSPMKNLFEMGKTEIRLKPAAVLRGKVYIEEIRADSIRFGTDRKVSGALPARPPKVKKEPPPKSDVPPLIDLKNFDAKALLEREYHKLSSPKLYDEVITVYNETLAKWQNQVSLAKTRGEELKAASQPILNLNMNSIDIKDVQGIQKTIQDITTMINTTKAAADDATKMVNGIEEDIKTARNLEQNARTAITSDINHLKSYVDIGSGAAFAALEPSIREVLSDTGGQYFDYGLRALEVLEQLKAQSAAQPKTEKPPKKVPKTVFKGRDVHFPTRAYPAFYLGVLASDFTLNIWNWAFDLRNVSSDPDLSGGPVTLNLALTEESGKLERQVAFKGSADFRSKATELYTANVNGRGFPVEMGKQLSTAGINGFKGSAAFSFNMSGNTGSTSLGGDIRLSQAQLVDPQGTLAEAIDTALKEAGQVNLGIQYTALKDQKDEFKVTTNIADLIAKAMKAAVEAYAKKALDEIEKVVRERLSQYIDGKFASKEDLDALMALARGDKAAMDQLTKSLTNKKTEFEQKAKGVADQAKKEATQQGQQAAKDVLEGKQPSLQVPSLPGGGGLKLPGR